MFSQGLKEISKSLQETVFNSHLHLLLCVEVMRFDGVRVDSMFWDIEMPQLAVCALMHTVIFRMFTALSYLCFHPWRKSSLLT